MEAFKEKTVGWLLVAGSVVIVISLIAIAMFTGGGVMHGTATRNPYTNEITDPGDIKLVPVAFGVLVIGVSMVGGAVFYGVWSHHTRFNATRQVIPNARILARYAMSSEGVMLTSDWELEESLVSQYLVRIQLSGVGSTELECRPETYFAAGEGMVGEAEVQGKWLGKFSPYIGVAPTQL